MTLLAVSVKAQIYSTSTMDLNNVNFHISNSGVLFNNAATAEPGYIVPKNNGTAIIYAAGLWFGGVDINGQLKLAAMRYGLGNDYRPGPYSTDFSYDSTDYVSQYGTSIWTISQTDVEDHIQNFNNPGYSVPASIANWPGNGDVSLGVAEQLAPYVDFNDNGIYEPQLGDYPLIKGCQATYMILTDHIIHTESFGDPIGLELHLMFYQYDGLQPEALSNTTFLDVRAINRSTQTLYDFYGGFFVDGDLGNYSDDYVGCDSLRNLGFMYNADNLDENSSGVQGYGALPPAFGVLSLNTPLSSFSAFTNSSVFPQADPQTAHQHHQFLRGNLADGTPMMNNQGQATKFLYSGDPSEAGSYSETGLANAPGDRRMLLAHNLDVLQPGTVLNLSYAIVYQRSGSNLESLEDLRLVSDSVQTFYDHASPYCSQLNVGLVEQQLQETQVFPNPSDGRFCIRLAKEDSGNVVIRTVSGAQVATVPFQGNTIDVEGIFLSNGVYIVEVQGADRYATTKLTIVR